MPSIKFDGTEILNTTYIPRFVKHESATDREMGVLDLAREDGSILISDRRGKKVIKLRGILTAASQSALETAIDAFKELFARQQKNLDISWEAGTRRYVASCLVHDFDRDHFHNLFVPWTAEFVVLSGIGEATSEDTIVNADTFTANYKTKAIALAGSAEPKIRFSIAIDSPNNTIKGVELQNTDTGARITVPGASSLEGKTVEIDTRLKTVKIDSAESPYFGIFPRFVVGTNNIKIICGDIIDQQFAPSTINSNYGIYGSYRACQGFKVPHSNTTYASIWLELSYLGDPSVAMDVRIETDNGGEPSGSLVDANAEGIISKAEMAGGIARTWYQIFFTAEFPLVANTQYWIVCKPHAGGLDVSNHYKWYHESGINATYKLGVAGFYDGGWTLYPDDNLKFKLCFGGKYDTTWTQTYSIYQTKRYI
jgi:hypothetical protein